jgi:hypothetical protein
LTRHKRGAGRHRQGRRLFSVIRSTRDDKLPQEKPEPNAQQAEEFITQAMQAAKEGQRRKAIRLFARGLDYYETVMNHNGLPDETLTSVAQRAITLQEIVGDHRVASSLRSALDDYRRDDSENVA